VEDRDGQDERTVQTQVQIPIEWHVPDGLTTRAVTNLVINHTPQGEFFITFFEITPPFVFDNEDSLRRIKSVRATAVTRVMIVGERMPAIIEALRENYERWKSECGERDKEKE